MSFIGQARVPVNRMISHPDQRSMDEDDVFALKESLGEDVASKRDVFPLQVILPAGAEAWMDRIKANERNLVPGVDGSSLFDDMPENMKFMVYSGQHRMMAAQKYLESAMEAHKKEPNHPAPSFHLRTWLCNIYKPCECFFVEIA